MSEIQTGVHEFKTGGFAHDHAQHGPTTVDALVEIAKGLPARLNSSDTDHEDHVEAYWTALSQFAYDTYEIEPETEG